MKHLVKNSRIIRSGVPSTFVRENGQAFWGGYEKMVDLHLEDGWVDEVLPVFDPIIQILSAPYFNDFHNIVTYKVLPNPNLPTLEKAKENKISQIKTQAGQLLAKTDWYVTRQIETGKCMPEEIVKERAETRSRSDELEAMVTSLSTVKSVVEFIITF